jgi:hypothetical protein
MLNRSAWIAYIRKRRPLEIEITFKQKIVGSWEQSAMHTVRILYVDRMLRTRGLSKVLQDSNYNNGWFLKVSFF